MDKKLPKDIDSKIDKKTRVLVNAIHAKSGGGVTYLKNILPLLAKDPSLEIHLLLGEKQLDVFTSLDDGISVYPRKIPNNFFLGLLWEQIMLPFIARNLSTNVTFSPSNYGPLFAPRSVIMLRNSLEVGKTETRLVKQLYWLGLRVMTWLSLIRCKRAIAVSKYAEQSLTFGLRKLLSKVEVIYHGVQNIFLSNMNQIREDFFLVVSDIYIQKNIHNLLIALASITDKFPNAKLKIAGSSIDVNYLESLNIIIEKNNLQDAVEFLGRKSSEELVLLYQKCQIFIFPSTIETFGNPLLEAMACGAPIACSNTAAMPEIAKDAALYFNPVEPDDIARKIIQLTEDKVLLKSLSQKSLARAELFSWEVTAEKTIEVIKSASNSRKI